MQVLAAHQGLSLEELALQQPDKELVVDRQSCSVLVQSVMPKDLMLSSIMVVGDPCADAAVLTEKQGKLCCLSCYARSGCRHVKAAQGNEQTEAIIAEATAAAFADKFSQNFDTSTGQRRVTSVSQVSRHWQCAC